MENTSTHEKERPLCMCNMAYYVDGDTGAVTGRYSKKNLCVPERRVSTSYFPLHFLCCVFMLVTFCCAENTLLRVTTHMRCSIRDTQGRAGFLICGVASRHIPCSPDNLTYLFLNPGG
ncbi:hypothetical protein FIBSPDRAFT_321831 [Athelia psychrophila]|uniref:Uncharacterized protein n=1 Tax=Athelia psychrophila TaxID=1759441 RepID=A0A166QJ88_9AGAM|nr:hypothetical protein FIBSPDRAFT_321831 [Fibularhizoctonia sp. CBS 109695]